MCTEPHCTHGVQDGNETGGDRGDGCGLCSVDAQFRSSEAAVLELVFEHRASPSFVPSFDAARSIAETNAGAA